MVRITNDAICMSHERWQLATRSSYFALPVLHFAWFLLDVCAHLRVATMTVLPERGDTRMYYTKQLAALRMEAFDRLHRPRESSSPSFLSSHTPSALSRAELGQSGRQPGQDGQDGHWHDKHEPQQHAQLSQPPPFSSCLGAVGKQGPAFLQKASLASVPAIPVVYPLRTWKGQEDADPPVLPPVSEESRCDAMEPSRSLEALEEDADASASGEGANASEGSGSEDQEDREEGFADCFHGRFDEPAREQQQAEYADERRLSEGSVVHEASVVHPPQCERAGSDISVENALLQGTVAQKENRDTRASGEIEPLQPRHTQFLSQVGRLIQKTCGEACARVP